MASYTREEIQAQVRELERKIETFQREIKEKKAEIVNLDKFEALEQLNSVDPFDLFFVDVVVRIPVVAENRGKLCSTLEDICMAWHDEDFVDFVVYSMEQALPFCSGENSGEFFSSSSKVKAVVSPVKRGDLVENHMSPEEDFNHAVKSDDVLVMLPREKQREFCRNFHRAFSEEEDSFSPDNVLPLSSLFDKDFIKFEDGE